ncbi:MAG: hypothetical protein A2Y12_02815 [Planctomycetes bacterium GWF2_42_9]|nr:MAG: hypothetical protein A2Y12_02815 [Planctomycetes bacterium GWF2_42_9]
MRINTCIILSLTFALVFSAFAAEDALVEWQKLNKELAELFFKGDLKEAQKIALRSLTYAEKKFGIDSGQTAAAQNNLALVYKRLGKTDKALPLYEQSLRTMQSVLGAKNPAVAVCMDNIAELLKMQGDYARAEFYYNQVVSIRKATLEPNDPKIALALNNLAGLYVAKDDRVKAANMYLSALQIYSNSLSSNRVSVAQTLNNLATLYESANRFDESELFYLKAIEIWTTIPGRQTNLEYAKLVNNYGMLKYKQGMYIDCEKLLVQANQIAVPVVGAEHPDVVKITNNLKSCREKLHAIPK